MLEIFGYKELLAAFDRNPEVVRLESSKFIQRGLAAYKTSIIRNPWRVGMSGGGAPVATGSMRDSHQTRYSNFEGSIGPNPSIAPYASYVHGVSGYPRKRSYQLRPWLDYAKESKEPEVQRLYNAMADTILIELAS